MADAWKPNLYVVARFLDALHQGARSRSDLQAAAGVNYDIFRRYLAFLEARGLVSPRPDGAVALTAEGARVRAELREWLARFLAPVERRPLDLRARAREEGGAPGEGEG